ncbi:hypothetical protein HRbin11_00393 [bacterium HR11]|nr:hypothetical protein HRbin11_00393 [bacterium HR11]
MQGLGHRWTTVLAVWAFGLIGPAVAQDRGMSPNPPSAVASATTRLAELVRPWQERAMEWKAEASYEVPVLDEDVRADGVLEPAWARAMVVRLPYEIQRGENRPAPVETLVLLGVTSRAFVVAFLCPDPRPDRMRVSKTDRDRMFDDDFVGLIVDTFGDRRHAYEVFVNPVGVQADGLRSEAGRQEEDMNFDFLWESGVRRFPDGYLVEIRIPFSSIRYRVGPDGRAAWRVMAFRNYPRDYRYLTSPIAVDFNRNCTICQFPVLTFPAPEASSDLMQVLPYGRMTTERTDDGTYARGAAVGLDLKYQPSPTWTADATVRPDFSQVETDVFQITTNIRFAPFYPEKRPFFMERSDLWTTPLQVLYTRTILDPIYGVRVTGQTGRHTVAFLHLMDRRTLLWFPGVQASDSTVVEARSLNNVFRYRLDLGQQSTVGVLLTDKEYAGGFNRLGGLDGRWFLSRQWSLSAQAVGTWTAYPRDVARTYAQPEDDFWGWAYRFQLLRDGKHWSGRWRWETRTEGFRADLGFIQQVGVRQVGTWQEWTLWPEGRWVSRFGWAAGGEFLWDGAWHQQGHEATVGMFFHAVGQTNGWLGVENFSERSGTVLFHGHRLFGELYSQPRSWLTLQVNFSAGDAVDYFLNEKARQFRVAPGLTLKLTEGFQVTYRTTYRRLSQTATLQDAWIQYARLEWQVTPALGLRQTVQWLQYRFPDARYQAEGYPARQQVLETQTLVRYRWNYATALYIGFYGRWATPADTATGRAVTWTVFAKFAYLFLWPLKGA